MWLPDQITVEILDSDRDVIVVEVRTPSGRLQLMGAIQVVGRTLYCGRAHIQGLTPGALGRAGLNAIGRRLLLEADVDQIIIEGAFRTTGRGEGRFPRPIRFPR